MLGQREIKFRRNQGPTARGVGARYYTNRKQPGSIARAGVFPFWFLGAGGRFPQAWRGGRFFVMLSLPRGQLTGPWLFSTAEARTSNSPSFYVQFTSINHQHSRGCVMVNGSTALQHGTSRPWPARAPRAAAAAHSSSLSCQPRPAAPPAEHGAPSTTEVESKKQRNPEAGMGFYFRGAGHVHVDERTCEWRGPVVPPSTTSALTRHHRPSGAVPTTTTTVARAAVCRAPLNHQVECVWLMIIEHRNNKK